MPLLAAAALAAIALPGGAAFMTPSHSMQLRGACTRGAFCKVRVRVSDDDGRVEEGNLGGYSTHDYVACACAYACACACRLCLCTLADVSFCVCAGGC